MHISEGEKADARMEQILDAIKDKDRETLRSLFSQKALEEAKEFDDGIDYLFDFFQGNIDSWERDAWSLDNGKDAGGCILIGYNADVGDWMDIFTAGMPW